MINYQKSNLKIYNNNFKTKSDNNINTKILNDNKNDEINSITNKTDISFKGLNTKYITLGIDKLNIPNLHILSNFSVRGESLSNKNNKRFIPLVKRYGIEQIIDLKTTDYSENFEKLIRTAKMDYHHYPIDSSTISSREIINILPDFFEQINKGHFYIACAQGKHRTDIALAINYVFNPKSANPPILYGHKTKNGLRIDDIAKRLNSIFKELTEEDKLKLGHLNFDEKAFKTRKKMLIEYNS